jgi:hypothetical protein
MNTSQQSLSTKRSRRGIGAVLLVVACAGACALPVVGGLIAGTFVDRFLDVPKWMVALMVLAAAAAATFVIVHRRRTTHDC